MCVSLCLCVCICVSEFVCIVVVIVMVSEGAGAVTGDGGRDAPCADANHSFLVHKSGSSKPVSPKREII